ncbi:M48 family metalloprotease [Cupriavidus basilensis]
MLLRDTYRIEADAHADVHAALAQAMSRLGIEARATLYQSPGQDMNASLVYVPGEVHIVLQGPLLERLAPPELLAVFGHELAHYLAVVARRRPVPGGGPDPERCTGGAWRQREPSRDLAPLCATYRAVCRPWRRRGGRCGGAGGVDPGQGADRHGQRGRGRLPAPGGRD